MTTVARDFELDDFQVRAIEALDAGRSVLVAAPTGSGKTVVAEHAVAQALAAGRRAFYTTPIKALSNQKYGDLARLHGAGRVGLLTGDTSINGDAPVVVMTTEVLRNMVYAGAPGLDRLDVVVLDEVHYLHDAYRGPVWEEVIIHLASPIVLRVPVGHRLQRRGAGRLDLHRPRPDRGRHRGAAPGHPRSPLPGRRPGERAAPPAPDARRRPGQPGGHPPRRKRPTWTTPPTAP